MTQRRTSYGDFQSIVAKEPARRTYAENLVLSSSRRETALLVLEHLEAIWPYCGRERRLEIIEAAVDEVFERGRFACDEAMAETFQRGWKAGQAHRTGQITEPGGSTIDINN